MNSVVIRHRPILPEVRAALASAVPPAWRRAVEGPANRLTIAANGARLEGKLRHGRPIDVTVAPGLVLAKRLAVPSEARQDLRHAVDLLIRSETPFAPSELLVDVSFAGVVPDGGGLVYDVRLLPRAIVLDALSQLHLRPSRVRRITVAGGGRGATAPDFAAALTPAAHWRRWTTAVPVVALLAAGVAIAHIEASSSQQRMLALEERTSERLAALRALTQELERARTSAAQGSSVTEAFASAVSVYLVLNDVRSKLPAATTLNRIEMRDGVVRLSVVTENALQDAKAFGEQLEDRSARVDGPITRDHLSGKEAAVIVVEPMK